MSGGEDASTSDQGAGAGDTFGIWDVGSRIGFDSFDLHFYKHHFFEDGSGAFKFQNTSDGLWGIAYVPRDPGVLRKIDIEFLNTKHQSGAYHDVSQITGDPEDSDVILGGRDSYYSNSAYKSGWTHLGHVVGTPFFLTSGSGDELRIASNRIRALHIGSALSPSDDFGITVKGSFARHYPPYTQSDADFFVESGHKDFFHCLLGISRRSPLNIDGLMLKVQGAFDVGLDGEFYYGGRIEAEYGIK